MRLELPNALAYYIIHYQRAAHQQEVYAGAIAALGECRHCLRASLVRVGKDGEGRASFSLAGLECL
jgi:hypothetical protein